MPKSNSTPESSSSSSSRPTPDTPPVRLSRSIFRLPEADELFPSLTIRPEDLTAITRNTVFTSLLRDIHAAQYVIQQRLVRERDGDERDLLRGQYAGLDKVLGMVEEYFNVQKDGDRHINELAGEYESDDDQEDQEVLVLDLDPTDNLMT